MFYNLLQRGTIDPGGQAWSQPTQVSELLVAESNCKDPAAAVVSLHSLACIRELFPGGPPGIQPGSDFTTQGLVPPIASTFAVAPVPDLDCTPLTVGRYHAPQYRVKFRDATGDGVVVYVDGETVLSLPASEVKIEILTSSSQFVLSPNPKTPVQTAFGLYVDAVATASVSWASRNGAAAAPGGLATFTQTQLIQSDGDPIGPTPGVILFERPPFAKMVTLVWDASLQDASGVLFVAEFMMGATRTMGLLQLGVMVAGNTNQTRLLIPSPATHVRITPLAAALPGALTNPIHAVWQIGVR